MPNNDMNPKRYPVKFPAPRPIRLPAPPPDKSATGEARELKTYVKDWLTVEEFKYLMPEVDIVNFMCYEAVGPDSWPINICAEDVLSCESRHAVQTTYINAVRQVYLGQQEQSPEQIEKIARHYGEISPDAVLFLMRLHEYLHHTEDNFEQPEEPDEATLSAAVGMMVQNEIGLHHLIKNPSAEYSANPQ